MRLKKIKLAGFKSFVDPTTIQIPSQLVGIVGPNGCGKSNIIDAVRWVMGESSAKTLRGDSMADVIFNGSSSRKPVGHAAVELVFDNSDGSISGEHGSYSEISVKRQVSRDGQSSYFLNGTRCRRRDITDIFLGTGLGPRSYAIIEQGMISRLIEAKPEELRVYFEEAAGISKYKERRRETENRMRHTRENLDRLNDLREEVSKQLQHLQRQAKTAEKYQVLKTDERQMKAELLALRWRDLDVTSTQRERKVREGETAIESTVAEQRAIEAKLEGLRETHVEATDAFNEVQGRFYETGAEIARLEQSIQHARDLKTRQDQELAQVISGYDETEAHHQGDIKRLEDLDLELLRIEPEYEKAREIERAAVAELAKAESRLHEWQQEWEQFNQKAAEPSQSAQVERTRIDNHEKQGSQLNQRIARFQEEMARLDHHQLESEHATLETQLNDQEQGLAVQVESLDALKQQINGLRAGIGEERPHLEASRNQQQKLLGRQASLEALQQASLGKNKGAVTSWLERHSLADAPRLAQSLQVQSGWEKAVEAVLGRSLEAVCVDGLDAVAQLVEDLQEGALTLFDTVAEGMTTVGELATPLISLVEAPWSMHGVLSGVFAVEDLNEALALRTRLRSHESVVTRDGIWVGSDWLRVARDDDAHGGVLLREQELKSIAEEVQQVAATAESLELRLRQSREQLQTLEEQRDGLQSEVNQSTRRLAEMRSQLSGKRNRIEQIKSRHKQIRDELEELQKQIELSKEESAQSQARLHAALAEMENHAQRREQLGAQREQIRAGLDEVRQKANQEKERVHEIALRVESMRSNRSHTQENLERMARQLEQLGFRRDALRRGVESADEPMEKLTKDLEEMLAKRVKVEAELTQARTRLEEIDAELRQLDQARLATENRAHELQQSLDQVRMAWQEIKVRRDTVSEQLAQKTFELQPLLENLDPEATESQWQVKVDDMERRIGRLGPINLAAIDEFAEQTERVKYLDHQFDDLTEALDILAKAIHKIDKETRTRFKETFDKVNSGLQATFPRLFGGGHAYLQLTGNDLLDTGVSVMARPPGKRNSTIHLLSGGEKALTAVALVFSIFQLNPAPFCMLDEVDAPLDEANVGRFCRLVEEMSEQVQFIFITHNKTTMEHSQQLLGVTMHEPGVSRMVSVDVDEAVELAVV